MDGNKYFLCTFLSAREHAFLKKMSDDISYSHHFFQIHSCPNGFGVQQGQQPPHSCLYTFRETVPLVFHSSNHSCNRLVTLIGQTNFASAHLSKSLLKKFTTGPSNPGETQGPTVLNCKSNAFIQTRAFGMWLYTWFS